MCVAHTVTPTIADRLAAQVTTVIEFPADVDGDALRRVMQDGADMASSMVIDFWVVAPDERSARAIAVLVVTQGFDPSIADDGASSKWSVYCSKSMLATYEGVVAERTALNALIAPQGGHCDGWATYGNGG